LQSGNSYFSRVIQKQESEDDWSHFSNNYPNIIGLTDEEIEDFIKNTEEPDRERIREYIKHIKCYNQEDIREVSKKTFKKFEDTMNKKYSLNNRNSYHKESTIFITSPRGGFDVLSDFGYANKLSKKNFPYDLERYEFTSVPTLKSESLSYGTSINDVQDEYAPKEIVVNGKL